ncbi:xanthine dehydrogenase family protein molybdopterin-binding subunit [Tamaricihabitans halophyticus]|nr:xanthine dehydrogenase family protein molybdopterin-binding subunit [Tamaricihabitans halophyticus]
MTEAIESAPAGTTEFTVVGNSPAHHDFQDKVQGTLRYGADWKLPGMLYGKVVRSLQPCARITAIDTSAARELPGVVAVLTASDVPFNKVVDNASGGLGELTVAQPVLAEDRVRYTGEPVALIAATEPEIAAAAVDLVDVSYADLPGIFDPEEALEPEAPLVHEAGNVLVNWRIGRGDAAAAMAAADVVITGEYRSQHVEHAYLEPESGVGWSDNGVLTLRVSTQVIEHASQIARILDVSENKVRIIASYMGGGFGGKEDMTVEPYLALLAWHTQRPVRMVWDRQESILASTKRHPFVMRYRTGAKADGTLLAQEIDIIGDAGAYPCLSARVLFAGAALAAGPYRVPNITTRSRAVFTNNVPASAFRGFGAMQVVFGYESQMDKLAERLGLTPTEIRDRNQVSKGDTIPTGESLHTAVELTATRDLALARLGPRSTATGPGCRVGRGFASGMQPYGRTIWFRDHASVWLTLQTDGSLLIRSGVTDLGAGQAASLCQIASEVLGAPLEEISVYIGDTALNPPAGGTFATRQLYMSGNAVLSGARELRDSLAAVAAEELGVPPDTLVWRDGMVRTADSSGQNRGIRLAELAQMCQRRGVSTSNLHTWRARGGEFDPEAGQGDSFPDYTYGTHAAEVEVDTETGVVRVLKYAASHDVGQQINPVRVQGQIQGGVMQGLGYALMEDHALIDGQPVSTLFANYLIPTTMDMPDIEVDVVESGEGCGPLNARGIGEPPVGPCAAAIASAIKDAIGVRPNRLPITPERVLELIDEQAAGRVAKDGDHE